MLLRSRTHTECLFTALSRSFCNSVTEKQSGRKFEVEPWFVTLLPSATVGLLLQTQSRFRGYRAPKRPQNAMLCHRFKLLHVLPSSSVTRLLVGRGMMVMQFPRAPAAALELSFLDQMAVWLCWNTAECCLSPTGPPHWTPLSYC